MRVLEDAMQRAFARLPEQMLNPILAEKLAEQGVRVPERVLRRLGADFLANGSDTVNYWNWDWAWKFWERQEVKLEITEGDSQRIEENLERIDWKRFCETVVSDSATRILADLERDWPRRRRIELKESDKFRQRIHHKWRDAIESLTFLVAISRELGEGIHSEIRAGRVEQGAAIIDVMSRMHARACQVSEEILCLLSAGFADGAMARWRTMYEMDVVTLFIHDHGEELAQRYLDHSVVESFNAARDDKECFERLGYEPISDEEFAEVESAKNKAVSIYGPGFGTPFGWASSLLQKKKPVFKDIEKAVSFDHFRSQYRLASYPVHAGAKSTLFRLSLPDGVDGLLTGPSDSGMADPGQNTAISLAQISAAFLMLHPILDNIVGMQIVNDVSAKVVERFAGTRPAEN